MTKRGRSIEDYLRLWRAECEANEASAAREEECLSFDQLRAHASGASHLTTTQLAHLECCRTCRVRLGVIASRLSQEPAAEDKFATRDARIAPFFTMLIEWLWRPRLRPASVAIVTLMAIVASTRWLAREVVPPLSRDRESLTSGILGGMPDDTVMLASTSSTTPANQRRLLAIGNQLFEKRDFESAAATYRQVLKQEPNNASAHCNLGAALFKLNKTEDAVRECKLAIALMPTLAAAQNNLAFALFKQGKAEEGLEAFQRSRDTDPSLEVQGDRLPLVLAGYDVDRRPKRNRVFSLNLDGNYDVYVTDPTRTKLLRLTRDLADDITPSLSYDGKRIAFARGSWDARHVWNGTEIWVMNADGTQQKQLTTLGVASFQPTWSPDGKKIAFTSSPMRPDPLGAENWEIFTMNADGSELRNVTNHHDYDMQPLFTRDGKQIIFVTTRAKPKADIPWALWIMNADGANPRPLTDSEWMKVLQGTRIGENLRTNLFVQNAGRTR